MNDLMIIKQDESPFIFSAREILINAGIDKSHVSRAIKRNIEDNEILIEGEDYINTIYSYRPTGDTQYIVGCGKKKDYLLTKKAMEFVLISLKTQKANLLRKSLIEKMNEKQAQLNPRQTIDNGLKLAYALIEAEKEKQKKEKEAELLILKAKGRQARQEVITKINELARKIGMELNAEI